MIQLPVGRHMILNGLLLAQHSLHVLLLTKMALSVWQANATQTNRCCQLINVHAAGMPSWPGDNQPWEWLNQPWECLNTAGCLPMWTCVFCLHAMARPGVPWLSTGCNIKYDQLSCTPNAQALGPHCVKCFPAKSP